MRILHVENLAGVASTLSRSQRSLGHRSDVLVTWPNKFGYPVDYDCNYKGKGIRLPLEMARVVKLASKYDILHIHGGLTRKRLDIVFSKMVSRKPFLFHFHGSETRMGYGTHYRWLMAEGVVSTPDLLRWWPDLNYVPNPIEMPAGGPNIWPDGPMKLVHFPTNRRFKGTDIIEQAVRILRGKGLEFDFRVMEGVPHSMVLEEMSRSHIVVDWISREDVTGIPGIYGNVSLEAMSLGRVAVAYIDPSVRPHYPTDLPVRSPHASSPEALADCLEALIADRESSKKIAEMGPKYVEINHDPNTIAKGFIDRYERILHRP